MKVLVTGATGFIGSEICNELKKSEYEIVKVQSKRRSTKDFYQKTFTKLIYKIQKIFNY